MGDIGQARKRHIVKAGESYESIFGRSFGDALRHFGGKMLNPGDELDLSDFQRHKDPFVSKSDVTYSQESNGANYQGPQMQQYSDYVKNYKAAIAEGYKGVRGSPYQGATGVASNDNSYVSGGVNDPARASIAPNYATGQTGQQTAANWQQANIPVITPAPVQSIKNPLTPQAEISLTNPTGKPEKLNATGIGLGPIGQGIATGADKLLTGVFGNNWDTLKNNMASADAKQSVLNPLARSSSPVQTTANKTPVQKVTMDMQNQQNAQVYTQAIMSNQNVPVTIQSDVAALIVSNAQLTGNYDVINQMQAMYDVGPNQQLVPRGTRFLPGSVNDPSFPVSDTMPGSLDYSNILPYGYDSGSNVRGRHSGGGSSGGGGKTARPARTRGTRSNDYNLGLGQ